MGAAANQPPVLQNKDLICMENRGNTLGDDDFGGFWKAAGQPLADSGFGSRIHRAGGVVQDQYLRRF